MMLTPDEIANVTAQIERLERSEFSRKKDIVIPVSPSEMTQTHRWSDLTPEDKADVLTIQVNWDGFNREQERIVIENVVAGLPPADWMEGVEKEPMPTPDEFQALAREIHGNDSHRSLFEKDVRYEDVSPDFEAVLNRAAERAQPRQSKGKEGPDR